MARSISIALLVCILATQLTAGVQYYVANTGNNANDGSVFTPWATVQHALDVVGPGDTVIVLDGYYPERPRTRVNGSAAAPITIKAQNRWGARMRGIQLYHSFYEYDGFDISLSGPDNGSVANFEGTVQIWNPATNCNVINNKFHDWTTYNSVTNQVCAIKCDYSLVPNYGTSVGNLVFSNNIITNLSYLNIDVFGYNVLSISNKLYMSNERDTWHLFGRDNVVRGNLVSNLNESVIIQDHTDFVQTYGDDVGIWSTNMVIEGNFVVNSETQIGQLEAKSGVIGGWTFRNNIFARCGLSCNVDIVDCVWEGNTFYRCTTNTSGPILLNNNIKGQATRAIVRNNLFIECGSDPANNQFGWYQFENNTGGWNSTCTVNYNMVAGTGGSAKRNDLFTELNGINGGNVLFTDAANNNFNLLQGSPAIGAGTFVGGVDFFGRLRANPPSMGAIEFAASGNTIIVQPTKCK